MLDLLLYGSVEIVFVWVIEIYCLLVLYQYFYFIVFIEVYGLGVVYDEINIAVNTCKGLVLSKKRLFALNLSFFIQ
ncbi:hypothetical protein cco8_05058 [Campylobacter coli 151-9]|nr:hypothetical protein cco8_05058 [Campylobacter coli 151-9]